MNRAPMHANYFAYESYDAARTGVKEESDNFSVSEWDVEI